MTTKRSGFSTRELDRILDELTKEKQEERMAAQRERLRVAKLKSQQGDNTKPRDCLITKKNPRTSSHPVHRRDCSTGFQSGSVEHVRWGSATTGRR
jgi:hypothetical protein